MALTARKIAEQEGRFAMELDLPLWATGKFFCHKDNAECGDCPLNNVCSKIFDKKNDYIAKANIRKPCICKNCSKI